MCSSDLSDRGVQIESLVGSGMMFLKAYTNLIQMKVDWNYGAQHLSPIPGLVLASRLLFFGSLSFTYALLASPRLRRDTLAGAWLLMAGFVTFGYVLSPQYLFWLEPLAIAAASRVEAGWRRSLWLSIFAAAVVLTASHFRFYWDYVNLQRFAVTLVLIRNLLLVTHWALSWRWMRPVAAPEARC